MKGEGGREPDEGRAERSDRPVPRPGHARVYIRVWRLIELQR